MQFEHNGYQYRIVFKYGTYYDRFHEMGRSVEASLLYLMDKEWRLVGFGYSRRVHTDRFVKEKGRRIALTRALKKWQRPFRTVAWKAYRSRIGGTPYLTPAARAMNVMTVKGAQ